MSTKAESTFTIKNWDEHNYDIAKDELKLARTAVEQTYSGALEGEGKYQSLLVYLENGLSHYVFSERIVGSVDGRKGSFIVQGSGIYTPGSGADTTGQIVPGSGTGDLAGISGTLHYLAKEGSMKDIPVTLEYSFT